MKTVFIVDDELLSRQSLKTSITWENYGYRLCGESSNGEQALKIISSQKIISKNYKLRLPAAAKFLISLLWK